MSTGNTFASGSNHLSAINRVMLNSFLSAFGHDPADFEIRVDEDSQLSKLLGLDDRFITVTRLSNGIERLYVATSYASWLAELLNDVSAGHYGRVRARRPQPLQELVAA